ncbi:hypothetical protein, partial [Cupriavidus sp. CuC1]|uniref:hypothetical protein n=1 Tax=Cupriavidus sp. CuC1 TaxID=3373131 RepID=UPI0037D23F51
GSLSFGYFSLRVKKSDISHVLKRQHCTAAPAARSAKTPPTHAILHQQLEALKHRPLTPFCISS